MSELIQKNDNCATIRWKLLTGASVLALAAYASSAGWVSAEEADQPQIWVELGGQLSAFDNSREELAPPFFAKVAAIPGFDSPLKFEKPSPYTIDEYGKLSFQPAGSSWVFSASVRYGRSVDRHHGQQQTAPRKVIVTNVPASIPPPYYITETLIPSFGKFADTQWSDSEKHAILDFQAGKDFGLGMFGSGSTSVLSAGIRFAQFSSTSRSDVDADPAIENPLLTHPISFFQFAKYHLSGTVYWEHDFNKRSFQGLGPSLSWQGSAPIAGNADSSEIAIDWGINAAVLFGRQKARGHHQTSSVQFTKALGTAQHFAVPTYIGPYVTHDRSRRVTVPNVGGSLGLSFTSGDAKVSFGYRADLFMNAMDTGIDTRKSSNMLFHGPYASISIGLGD